MWNSEVKHFHSGYVFLSSVNVHNAKNLTCTICMQVYYMVFREKEQFSLPFVADFKLNKENGARNHKAYCPSIQRFFSKAVRKLYWCSELVKMIQTSCYNTTYLVSSQISFLLSFHVRRHFVSYKQLQQPSTCEWVKIHIRQLSVMYQFTLLICVYDSC
jgi:hypothetical protein